jgi:hypothetical protein
MEATLGTPTYLAVKNAHERDVNITFEPVPHIYTICGERGTYTSVTTWNHSHFSHFDADGIIDKMFSSKKIFDPKHKYYGMSKDEIKDKWEVNRVNASGSGTQMHDDIEKFYNGIEVDNNSVEFGYFKKFLADFPELVPYRTEWMIYHEDVMLSGSIDMVFENKTTGHLEIYDWKRCQEIKHEAEFGKYGLTTEISHLPDTNFWHYSLQLNTYKKILEDKYGKIIDKLYLVCLHPDNHYKTYERIEVPSLQNELDNLFELRIQQLNEKGIKN